MPPSSPRLAIAPMMRVTNRHFRELMRLLCDSNVELYTEMQTSNFLLRGERSSVEAALRDERNAKRTWLQIGGNDEFERVGRRVERYGYMGLNINVGCPSPRVSGAGQFGASLMRRPERVGRLAADLAEGARGRLPVSVKCRVGVVDEPNQVVQRHDTTGEREEYERLAEFVETVHRVSGEVVTRFDVHARCAVLRFDTKQNRRVPPIKYDYVYRLCQDFPHLSFALNGQVSGFDDATNHVERAPALDAIMIGRAARDRPADLAPTSDVRTVAAAYAAYAASELVESPGTNPRTLLAPLINLVRGQSGAREFRRAMSDGKITGTLDTHVTRALEGVSWGC